MEQTQQLKDLCRTRRNELHMSAQQIADLTDLPISTVNKFFADASKSPSIYTAGPICRVLGVDLNEYFDITPADPESARTENERLKAQAEIFERVIAAKNRWIRALAIALGVVLLGIIAVLIYDLSMLDRGWFQAAAQRYLSAARQM